ncbi:MAG: glycosyltransferase [Planctomycetes bacterium]|nr:glycosyltransferase [Planctomycetota bacterium]
MDINLFFLSNAKYGGAASYTVHLKRSFEKIGHQVNIFKVKKKTEWSPRLFSGGEYCQTISMESAIKLANMKRKTSLITCVDFKKFDVETMMLLIAGTPIVLHSPNEYHKDLLTLLKRSNTRIVVNRLPNVKSLQDKGLDSTLILHPYIAENKQRLPRWADRGMAVSISRIDRGKNIEILIEANNSVDSAGGEGDYINVYGAENGVYTRHTLDKNSSCWREDYFGKFPAEKGSAVSLCAQYKYMVDMSVIDDDGDGMKYTFLEAVDAGAVCIINAEWFSGDETVWRKGGNCLIVENVDDLVKCVNTSQALSSGIARAARKILEDHKPETIIPQFEKFLESSHNEEMETSK